LHAVAVVVLAVALDLALGDPPNAIHPVAWMGRAIAVGRRNSVAAGRLSSSVAAARSRSGC
jgi:adenosylcobinamide-phosphate synthase